MTTTELFNGSLARKSSLGFQRKHRVSSKSLYLWDGEIFFFLSPYFQLFCFCSLGATGSPFIISTTPVLCWGTQSGKSIICTRQCEVGAKGVGVPGSSELKQGLFKTISHTGCNNSHVVLTTFFNENLLCVFYAPGFKCLSSVRQSPCCIKWEVALQWLWAVYILGYHIYLWGKS